jgi:hypothetical protein
MFGGPITFQEKKLKMELLDILQEIYIQLSSHFLFINSKLLSTTAHE